MADRFPTAEERWPRQGEVLKMSDRIFCVGNGQSRKGFDLESLRPHGRIYGCNALYRDFVPDVLISVDHATMHEIYHTGYAWENEMWCRDWTKVPIHMYDRMLQGGIDKLEAESLLRDNDILKCNERDNTTNQFVMHGSNLQGIATIIKKNKDKVKEYINHNKIYVSFIKDNDKSHTLTECMKGKHLADVLKETDRVPKDLGWSAGPTAGYIACARENPKEIYMIGHDLYSQDHKVNNIYAGTKHYVTKEHGPTPCINWINQWAYLFKEFRNVQFYKVNKDLASRDKTNQPITEWAGGLIHNLHYINYQDMLDKLLKV